MMQPSFSPGRAHARCAIAFATVAAIGAFAAVGSQAHAEPVYEGPITDSQFAIDGYNGSVIGSPALIGMGGAGSAAINGTAGTLLNPSALAVRPDTDASWWNWDFHLDALTARSSQDFDNSGSTDEANGASAGTSGIGFRIKDLSLAAVLSGIKTPMDRVDDPSENPFEENLESMIASATVVVGWWAPQIDLAIGLSGRLGFFNVTTESDDSLFQVRDYGFGAGVTWIPRGRSMRLAAAYDSELSGGEIRTRCSDRLNCFGHIVPDRISVPERIQLGVAYRLAATAWNRFVPANFRDERSLTLVADLVVAGKADDGYGIEAYSRNMLQRSGRDLGISPRAGAEAEVFPGRLRLRAGTYWEPSRFDGVDGRLHVTFGVELRLLQFHILGPRRGRISLTGDSARKYQNVAFSIGFWH